MLITSPWSSAAVKSVEVLEGDGGPETIKLMALAKSEQLGSQNKTEKHKVEALDRENFTYCYSIIEGEVLGTTFEKISYQVKITALPLVGSVLKCTNSYFTNGDVDVPRTRSKPGNRR
ncbi:major allergen Pru av 1-like [Eucalyptus grandis]|uniref:major allergen Pru av 1-like n=1 Tax=Eucalyptus grandis TaxID=71139 RepID=UPI00192F00FA|nr:major allergen Pru av 1-like [Eucalyptus grandis]